MPNVGGRKSDDASGNMRLEDDDTCVRDVPCIAENQRSCVYECWNSLPKRRRLADQFPIKLRQTTTDPYAANYRTERGLRLYMKDFTLLHLTCDAHKEATCIKCCLGACEAEVSGLIDSSLALSELGVLQLPSGGLV